MESIKSSRSAQKQGFRAFTDDVAETADVTYRESKQDTGRHNLQFTPNDEENGGSRTERNQMRTNSENTMQLSNNNRLNNTGAFETER